MDIIPDKPIVSVIITTFNYAHFISSAIESVKKQSMNNLECLIIDDGSTDNTKQLVIELIRDDARFRYFHNENMGVAYARNKGINLARAPFIACLDADDWYHPEFLMTLTKVLASDRAIGVAYTGLEFHEGDKIVRTWNPPKEFDWDFQTRAVTPPEPPATMIPTPSACMFRKEMWTRSGGYKQVYAPGEDTEFMVRGLSVGFKAQPVNSDARTNYRLHPGGASRTKKYDTAIHTWHPWMLDREFPFAAPLNQDKYPTARSYALPTVSVIIPVASKHLALLPAALDSLLGQTFRNWEVVVITDNCELTPDILTVYPFIEHYPSHGKGVSEARNTGLGKVRAPLVLFLDADDWLAPQALQKLVVKYGQSEGRYVYLDAIGVYQDGKQERINFLEYDPPALFQLNASYHAVTVLMATEQARALQFSPHMRGFEDWDFFIRAAIAGYHGVRLAEPLLFIRRDTGHFSDLDHAERQAYRSEYILKHYKEYETGVKPMAGCGGGCGGAGAALMEAKNRINQAQDYEQTQVALTNGKVRMEYIGAERGAVTIHVNGHPYRGADSNLHKYTDADPADVDKLVATGKWRIVRSQVSAPAPMVMPPSNPMGFNWGATAQAENTKPTQVVEIPQKPLELEVSPAFQDDYAVTNMTISDVKTAIGSGVDKMTLLGWLTAEQTSEKPRAGVVSAIEKALA